MTSRPVPILTGTCSRCGLCCTADVEGTTVVCDHLRRFAFSSIGRPEATQCGAYARRWDGMPITMRSADGAVLLSATCRKDSPEETTVIVARGIGRGCSMEVAA